MIAPRTVQLCLIFFVIRTCRAWILKDNQSSRYQLYQSGSRLTEWVVENLETPDSRITSSSVTRAGENDSLPPTGLTVGKLRILAADAPLIEDNDMPIRLLVGRNGWGTGVHPTTRLCLEWIQKRVQGGDVVLDYGCGSGILSIAALHMGAAKCIGVDVEAEALVVSERNIELNGYGGRFEGLHVREVLPYGIEPPADVVLANIRIGQLVRPSMVAALVSNLATGGYLCLSGIRPDEVDALRDAYNCDIDWVEADFSILSATETPGSIASYGYDCGVWAVVVGRKVTSDRSVERMSELAVA